jgi:hypothetical protein
MEAGFCATNSGNTQDSLLKSGQNIKFYFNKIQTKEMNNIIKNK